MIVDTPPPGANAPWVSAESPLTPIEAAASELAMELRSHAELVGASLRSALEEVVLAISGPTPRPSHLITLVGLDKTLAGRIIQTIRSPHALATLVRVPAPHGLGMFLRAASAAGIRPESIARAEESLESFERLLSRFPQGRAGLEAAISGWIPEAREQGERTARQSVYKAMSFLFGYQSDAALGCTVLKPNPDGTTLDVAFVSGQFGLRRLRVGEPLSIFGTRYYPKGAAGTLDMNPRTLDGRSIEEASCVLEDFCEPRVPKLDIVKTKDQRLFVLPAGEPGLNVPISMVVGHAQTKSWRRYASPDQREEWLTMLARCPTRVLINDTFIRDDVYLGVEPVVTTHIVGMSPLPARERGPGFPLDEVHLTVDTGWITGDLRDIGTGVIPRYPELIAHAFEKMGEDLRRYRIHRLRMNYPVTGIAATRWFKLPENPNQ